MIKIKTNIINKVLFGINIKVPYSIDIIDTKKVPKDNNFIREYFLHKIGTMVLNIDTPKGNKLIIQPIKASLKFFSFPKVGNRGDINE